MTSGERPNQKTLTAFLVFDSRHIIGTRKSHPDLKAGEHAIKITLQLPANTFRADLPTAVIDVPEPKIIHPVVTVAPVPSPTPSPS